MKTLLALLLMAASVPVAVADEVAGKPPTAEAPSAIEYASPEAAFADLKRKAGVKIREEDGWLVASDPREYTIWSLTKPGNEAHPTIVKRSIVREGEMLNMIMSVDCGASKEICDHLVRSFQQGDAAATEPLSDKP